MVSMTADLPTGRRGRLLALGLTLAVLGTVWVGVVAPLADWYESRAQTLADRRVLVRRMGAIAASLPDLQRREGAAEHGAPATAAVLDGGTDAIAAAHLQELVQAMAAKAGATISSLETLPAQPADGYRRLALRVSLNATWPVLIALLQAIEQASPRLLVDDLRVEGSHLVTRPPVVPLDAMFTIIAFRSGGVSASR